MGKLAMMNLKILVCYYKPAFLYKSNILVPIQVGRACDSSLSDEDRKWLHENTIGDDSGDNISELNPYFAELTAIYWAWKNYDKLGNPEYVGLCHYRRLFSQKNIEEYNKYDITAPFEANFEYSIKDQFISAHRCNDIQEAVDLLCKKYPAYQQVSSDYLDGKSGYFYNMFIMKKEIFFEYCEILFSTLLKMHKSYDYDNLYYYNHRMLGFLAERLTGIFIKEKEHSHKIKKCKIEYKDKPVVLDVFPAFGQDAISVCLPSDNNYAPYLCVAISSIKENRKQGENYDIFVLDGGINEVNKELIRHLADKDFSIRFINSLAYIQEYDSSLFKVNAHLSVATYYRFLIPKIFKHFDKILYIDSDVAVNRNIAELYNTPLHTYALAAVTDIEMHRQINNAPFCNDNLATYLTDSLKMKHPEKYLQAGVILFDINKLQKMNFTKKCIDKLAEIKDLRYLDQCVINSIFDGNYKALDMRWNVLWHIPYYTKNLNIMLEYRKYIEYFNARKNPWIIHYSGAIKPWTDNTVEMADIWWKYARNTPFYEYFVYMLCKLNLQIPERHSKLNQQIPGRYIINSVVRFLGVPLFKIRSHTGGCRIYLFKYIPLLKVKSVQCQASKGGDVLLISYIKLFNFIPVLKCKKTRRYIYLYLFNILPLYKHKQTSK